MSSKGMETKPLGEILNLRRGHDLPIVEMQEGEIPVIGSNGIIGYHNKFTTKAPCLTVGRSGSVGKLFYSVVDSWVHNTALYVDDFKGNDPKYVYYLLQTLNLAALHSGSVVPSLNRNYVHPLKVKFVSSVVTQQKIAAVLSALDAKIELNQRINAELESMAKTLYDYWFVQFDFPNEKGKPYKSAGGKMVWNEELKREIPLGWEVKKFADWIESDKSGDWGSDEPKGNYIQKVSCIRGTDINGLNGTDTCNPPTRFILEKNAHKILNSHDLIIEISGGAPKQSTGRLGYITDATLRRFENPLICSNFCKAISIKDKKFLYNFVYHWNMLYDNGVFFGYEGKTSGIKNLLFDSFVNSHLTVVPPSDLVDKFYEYMQGVQAKKQTALLESQTLTELRDWLLPLLMNGQVKV
jgi:type I restriction enzyme S subunit